MNTGHEKVVSIMPMRITSVYACARYSHQIRKNGVWDNVSMQEGNIKLQLSWSNFHLELLSVLPCKDIVLVCQLWLSALEGNFTLSCSLMIAPAPDLNENSAGKCPVWGHLELVQSKEVRIILSFTCHSLTSLQWHLISQHKLHTGKLILVLADNQNTAVLAFRWSCYWMSRWTFYQILETF